MLDLAQVLRSLAAVSEVWRTPQRYRAPMSFRERLLRVLARGEAVDPPADAIVQLEEVWLHEGPRLVQVLENAGIEARGVEATNIATEGTASNRMRIFVHHGDLAAAGRCSTTIAASSAPSSGLLTATRAITTTHPAAV